MLKLSHNCLDSFPDINKDLKQLDISNNRLTSLKIDTNLELEYLDASYNSISGCVSILSMTLNVLCLQGNRIKTLDLRNCINLGELVADYNDINEIFLPKNITRVCLSENSLLSIDIPNSVEFIEISGNQELSKVIFHENSCLNKFLAMTTDINNIDHLPDSVTEINISKSPILEINRLPKI